MAWLVAEEEDDAWGYDDYDEDMSVWSECDNYILRTSVIRDLLIRVSFHIVVPDSRDHQ